MAPNNKPGQAPGWADYQGQQRDTQAQLQQLLGQPVARPRDRKLSDADRKREFVNFGLALMQAGANPNNNLFSALGQAGQATMADADRRKQAAYQQDADARKAKAGALAQALDYLNHQKDFAADRSDAAATRDYRNSRLDMKAAQAKQDAKLNAAQIDATHALADKRRGVGGGGSSGPYDPDQSFMTPDMQREWKAYISPYQETDQYGRQMITGNPMNVYQWRRTRPELMGQPAQASGLEQLRQAAVRNQLVQTAKDQGPYNVPVPMRGGTDYLDGLR